MWRIIFMLSIPALMIGGLIAPIAWVWSVDHWKGLLLTIALIALWATKAIWEHKP